THELSLGKLGGLFRSLPYTAVTALVASCAVLGIPGFSGFASKTLIHEAILEVANHSHSGYLLAAEKLFILGSALTAAYFIKLFVGVFLGKYKGNSTPKVKETGTVKLVLSVYTALILLVGIFPYKVLHFLESAATGTVIDYQTMLDQLHHVHLWSLHAYQGIAIPLVIGIALFFLARRSKFLEGKLPRWLSIETVFYRPIYEGFIMLCCRGITMVDGTICQSYDQGGTIANKVLRRIKKVDDIIDDVYEQAGQGMALRGINKVEETISDTYDQGGKLANKLLTKATIVDDLINDVSQHSGQGMVKMAQQVDSRIDAAIDGLANKAAIVTEAVAKAESGLQSVFSEPAQIGGGMKKIRLDVWNIDNITISSLVVAIILLIVMLVLYKFGGLNLVG
ncbi:MAG: hypothetical protein Q8N36_04640, partial [bacterium]|nr:hypothetical protein [bacterium]